MTFHTLNSLAEAAGKFHGNYSMPCKMWCHKNILLTHKRWNEVGNGLAFKGTPNTVDEMSWNKTSHWLKHIQNRLENESDSSYSLDHSFIYVEAKMCSSDTASNSRFWTRDFFRIWRVGSLYFQGQQIVARFARQTSYDSPTTTLAKRGHLNLHLFSETCASDLDILCNFPMFPNAPDNRLLLNTTNVTKDLIGGRAGLRLFGFITPAKSGLYTFTVKFCHAEVWLSQNENWRHSRKICDAGNFSKQEIKLTAGKNHFIEVVATCLRQRNKVQLLWKTPASSVFEVINETFLSSFVDDNGLNSKIYDELLPDSPVCTSRRYKTTYFQVYQEISYLSHDEVQDILPYCDYHPSYTVEKKWNTMKQ